MSDAIPTIIVGLALSSAAFGIGMAFYMNDATWLWFCLSLLIFGGG